MSFIKKFIGNKQFYKTVLVIALPIMVQNGITNFVSFLDNIMVGRVGTEEMSAVGIVNQIMFVYNLCIFGAISGAGIFTVQYFGKGDTEGIRFTFRFKMIICFLIAFVAMAVFILFGTPLIKLFLNEGSVEGNLERTLSFGKQYLAVVIWGMIPYCITQYYSGTLRELGHTVVPMLSGAAAVLVNFVFNWLLIFGELGFPKLGVVGAGIATVIARVVECAAIILYTHLKSKRFPFILGVYRSLKIPKDVFIKILIKGTPLFLNESLWATGISVLAQCYSLRGLSVIAAVNIASTVLNVFNIAFIALGNSVGIIVGKLLGAGEFEKAKDTDNKLIFFSVSISVLMGAVMFISAKYIPELYNINDEVKKIAEYMLRILSVFFPVNAFMHATYFTLRSGGKTFVTFLFDSVFECLVSVPLAFCLAHFTELSIFVIYPIVLGADIIKCVIGFIMLKKNVWIHNISQREIAE